MYSTSIFTIFTWITNMDASWSNYLVGGVNHLGKDDIPYMKWKIKAMFETTNQYHIQSSSYQYWTLRNDVL